MLVRYQQETCHYLPNGFKKFVVHNVKELELLMMHNSIYCAEIAHDVSIENGKDLILLILSGLWFNTQPLGGIRTTPNTFVIIAFL